MPHLKHIRLLVGLSFFCFFIGCSQNPASPPKEPSPALRPPENQLPHEGTVARVLWSEDGAYLYYTCGNQRFRFDLERKERTSLYREYQGVVSANITLERRRDDPPRGRQHMTEPSPDGNWTAVCRDWNVVIQNNHTKDEIQVTTEGNRKFRYGAASWVYSEELGQINGMWWAPDSDHLAFYQFDERPVKDFYLLGDLTRINTALLIEGYPKAGQPNPVATLLIYHLESKTITPVDCGDQTEQYIYHVRFRPDGRELLFNRLNRRQNRLQVMAADVHTGQSRAVLTETQKTFQKDLPLMRFLADGQRFIWETEKTGWPRYELRRLDGSFICNLTPGRYVVSGIQYLDEAGGWLFYSAYSDQNPLNLQLHKVRLDGTDQKRLTNLPFNHSNLYISPDKKWFVIQYEAVDSPPATLLYDIEGNYVAALAQSADRPAETGSEPVLPELFSYKADDGITDIYGILYKPSNFDPRKKYPLVLDIYGGPGSQRVRNQYQTHNPNTEYGFIIAHIDNRGTPNRGKAFETATYLRLGTVDVKDLADGVKFLRQRPYIDGSRVGIVGHSYGGYLALMALLKYPDLFHAAVDRAGPTNWSNYDTIWTERYMRTPQENPEGYRLGSCLNFVSQLKGKLLIMHGLVDDNVHPNNAFQLIDALDQAGKKYESRFFPGSGHGFDGRDTQWEFFYRHLILPLK